MAKKQDITPSNKEETNSSKSTLADSKNVIQDFFSIKKKLEDIINRVKVKKEG